MFSERKFEIAPKHEKEKVIAPLFQGAFGVKCFTFANFDTDKLGTFTGESEGRDDAITTLGNKCLQALVMTNCYLGIASEGSFGSHPTFLLALTDDEFLIFIDEKNNFEIVKREFSTKTYFKSDKIKTEKQLTGFANRINFPSHELILLKA